MENVEVIRQVLLYVAVGCLCLAIPLGLIALRMSPWWRRRAKRKKRSIAERPTARRLGDEIRRTGTATTPKQFWPRTPYGAAQRPGTANYTDYDEMFPNGYTRAQYHEAGIDDSTIEYWGFDRDPSAPSPLGAGEAIAEAMDEGWW